MDFNDFWQIFPRRVGKGAALKAFDKALRIASPDAILEGAKRYASECVGKELHWVAHPATWLNGQRWLDEPGHTAGNQMVQPVTYSDQDAQWVQRLKNYRPGGFWASTWGLRPERIGHHDCPRQLLDDWRAQNHVQILDIVDKSGRALNPLDGG